MLAAALRPVIDENEAKRATTATSPQNPQTNSNFVGHAIPLHEMPSRGFLLEPPVPEK